MKREKDQKRRRKPITESSLRNAALRYLEQYASGSENLRRVLLRRVAKARMQNDDADANDDTDADRAPDAEAWIDTIIERFQCTGVLDDAAFAEAQVQTLHRRGVSAKGARYRLSAKGVGSDDIDAALGSLESLGENDKSAACNYARRRRIGPWRRANRKDNRDRDLAALGRQGFTYQIARLVIDSPDVGSLEIDEDQT
ncbi:MAG: RecX family transcriptional regulator [Alphaproteobacteria bacterium]|nr:RecX family transcriptional regulator [Alphaproteobacteria bacterium]